MKKIAVVMCKFLVILLQIVCLPSLIVGDLYLPLFSEITTPFFYIAKSEMTIRGPSLLGIVSLLIAIILVFMPVVGVIVFKTKKQYYWGVFFPIIISMLQTTAVTLVNVSSLWNIVFFVIFPGFYVFVISILKGLITLQLSYFLLKDKKDKCEDKIKKTPCVMLSIVLSFVIFLPLWTFYGNEYYRYETDSTNEIMSDNISFYNSESSVNPCNALKEREKLNCQSQEIDNLDDVIILAESNNIYLYGVIYKRSSANYLTIVKTCSKDLSCDKEICFLSGKIREADYNQFDNDGTESNLNDNRSYYFLLNGYLYCSSASEVVLRYDCRNDVFEYINVNVVDFRKELKIQSTRGIRHIRTTDGDYYIDLNDLRNELKNKYGYFMFFLNYKCHSKVVFADEKLFLLIKSPIFDKFWLITEIDYKNGSIICMGTIKDEEPSYHFYIN